VTDPQAYAGPAEPRFFDRPVALGVTAMLALELVVISPIGPVAGAALLAVAGARTKRFRRMFVAAVRRGGRWRGAERGQTRRLARQ